MGKKKLTKKWTYWHGQWLFVGAMIVICIINLLLLHGFYAAYKNATASRNRELETLRQQLDYERLKRDINQGRLDIICENHPAICEGIE